jgi:hypothetical protein
MIASVVAANHALINKTAIFFFTVTSLLVDTDRGSLAFHGNAFTLSPSGSRLAWIASVVVSCG